MIIKLNKEVDEKKAHALGNELQSIVLKQNNSFVLVTPSKLKDVDGKYTDVISESISYNSESIYWNQIVYLV